MGEITYNFLIHSLGAIGILASIMSFQCEKHKKLIFFRTANELSFAVQYFLLGAYTGMTMNIIGCIRNVIFAKMVEKNKSTVISRCIFSVIFFIFALFTWEGMRSALSGVAKVLSTFAYGCSNTFIVRLVTLITSSCWLIYNYYAKSYAGCICEILTLVSIVIALLRIDMPKVIKRKEAANGASERNAGSTFD